MVEKASTQKSVVVAGLGYVGLPLAIAAVNAGYLVHGVDNDESRVQTILGGRAPVEDVEDDVLETALRSKRLVVHRDYGAIQPFDFGVITVPTPLHGLHPDLSQVISAAKSLAENLRLGSTVILESTTYPGTTEDLLVPMFEMVSGLRAGADFHVGYSPERIDPGNKEWTFTNIPKLTSGIDEPSLIKVVQFYSSVGINCERVSGTREAELAKLLENTFRHVNIALINEIAVFAASLGVDVHEAVRAASTKPFGFMSFRPGIGVGGHCLPIDTAYLSWAISEKTGFPFRFGNLANEINATMPMFVLEKLEETLAKREITLRGAKVLIIGLAYKPDTGDTRESPSISLADLLINAGAEVFAVDDRVSAEAWPKRIQRIGLDDAIRFSAGVVAVLHSGHGVEHYLEQCEFVLSPDPAISGDNVIQLWP